MVDQFKLNESRGRKLMKFLFDSIGITQYEFTKGAYDVVDGFFLNKKGIKYSVEVKTRKKKYSTYYMEEFKYNNMRTLGCRGIYVNFVDDKAYVWTLDFISKCPKKVAHINICTAKGDAKMDKTVFELPISAALKYKLEGFKYIKISD